MPHRTTGLRAAPAALLVLILAGLSACSSNPVRVDSIGANRVSISCDSGFSAADVRAAIDGHIIEIDESGRYLETRYDMSCPDGQITDAVAATQQACNDDRGTGTIEARLCSIKQRIVSGPNATRYDEIAFIVHGGLVSRSRGLEEAIELTRAMVKDNVLNKYSRYPIFLNWRSGAIDAYADQTWSIRKGKREPLIGPITAPIELASDLGRGIADTPASGGLEGARLVSSIGESINACQSTRGGEIDAAVICPTARGAPPSTETIAYFVSTPVRILAAPIINGPGRSAWENMVRRTRNPVWREESDEERTGASRAMLTKGAGARLFDAISVREQGFDIANYPITLIGHSMGTMVLSDLVRAHPRLPYSNIVYMAAAMSIRDFSQTVEPVLQDRPSPALATDASKAPAVRFFNLSLLPKREARELSGYGLLPSGSLLEWIDEMYTPPTTPLDRTLGKWVNVRDIIHTFTPDARGRMTFKVFGDSPGEPDKHGDFNEVHMCFWRDSFWNDVTWKQHTASCKLLQDRL